MMLLFFLLMIIAALPVWPYSRNWGYRPVGLVTLSLAALIALAIFGPHPSIGLFEISVILAVIWIVVFAFFRRTKRSRGQVVFCRRCGQQNPVSQNFCGRCGHELPDLTAYELRDVSRPVRETERSGLNPERSEMLYDVTSVTERTTSLIESEPNSPTGTNQPATE